MSLYKTQSQVLSTEKSVRTRNENIFTKAYQDVKKEGLTSGLLRVYTPKNEDGDKLPQESKAVVLRIEDAIATAADATRQVVNIVALKDATNLNAKADIVVDGATLVKDVPATHLLFLEKRCIALIEFISSLPVLSQDASWTRNEGLGLFESAPVESFKTKKEQKFPIVVPATDKHPAQVKDIVEDVIVGTWKSVQFSGAITPDRKKALLTRAEKIQQAVKIARELANQAPVVELSTSPLVDFIFA